MTTPTATRAHAMQRDALGDIDGYLRLLSSDELCFETDSWARIAASDDVDPWSETCEFYAIRRDAGQREIERRERLSRVNPELLRLSDARYQKWVDRAKVVSSRVDLIDLFTNHLNYLLRPAGFNSTRNAPEWAGACPLCAGTDRFWVWGGPSGIGWCRRCDWSCDAITAVRTCEPGCRDFHSAVRFLGRVAGIVFDESKPEKPAPVSVISMRPAETEVTFPSGLTFMPIRRGAQRVR
jgi:hypothetical protein